MNLSREDIAATVGSSFLFAVGAWAAIDPKSCIRYFLKNRLEDAPNRADVRSWARSIGVALMILSALTIAATLKMR